MEETEGNSFKLEGRVAGSQPITVAWYKNNVEIHPTSNCEITFKNNALLLQVKRASMADAGLYTCKATNDAGSALCTSSIVIKGERSSQPWPWRFLHTPPCMYLLGSGLSVEPPTKTCVVGWVVAVPYVFAQKRMICNFILWPQVEFTE